MAGGDGAPLSEEAMELSEVSKTVKGAGFTYARLSCVGKQVGSIQLLEKYPHLRHIDLSSNSIQDPAPLSQLTHVLSLNLASNAISSISCWTEKDLQHLLFLDLSGNKLTALPKLFMPVLRTADFSKNEIATCSAFGGHSTLSSLRLSENKLDSVEGLVNMPQLETLELGQNSLNSLDGLKMLPSLLTLNISKNSFAVLDGPWKETPKLSHLDASANSIADTKAFLPLARLGPLRKIEVAGAPIEEQDGINIRLELLICHGDLAAINGEEVTAEDKEEAKALNEKRIEEEAERVRAEEEARLAAEAGGAEAEE